MSTKIMIIDNDAYVHDHIMSELGESFDLDVVGRFCAGPDTLDFIKNENPEIVLMNVLPTDHDTVKSYLQAFVADASVKFLTISRYPECLLVIAVFGANESPEKDFDLLVQRLAEEGRGGRESVLGRYTLKGVSLQCA